jgi:zinc transport system substrate-binding protein
VLALALALAFAASSCGSEKEESDKLRVVVSLVPLAGFVENVGGGQVDVTVMVPSGASPHTYEPTSGSLVAVSKADLFVKVGSGVEFELTWMDKVIDLNRSMLVVDSSRGVTIVGNDPHIWLSPLNARTMVENICSGLIEADPENESYYVQNKDDYLTQLDELHEEIRENLEGVANRAFMVFHPSWGYFAGEYGLEQIAVEIEGKEPSAKDMANLIEKALERNIKIVFASPQFNQQSARTIADEIGGEVVSIDPLAEDYITNMRRVLGYLVQELK